MVNAEINTFKAVLESKRQELIRGIRSNAAGLILESGEAELIDQIQGMAGRDELAILLNRFSSTLEDVERSLLAIADGSYGVCGMCDEPIAPKRLQAIPWAAHCVHCQEQIEAAQQGMADAYNDPARLYG